jgi:very-short-patch-repair endonuclease
MTTLTRTDSAAQAAVRMTAATLRSVGGVASYLQLEAAGQTRAQIAQALRAGTVTRVRNGWFAAPDAPVDVVRAVRVGGTLTGASVARLHGLWLMSDPLLHVRVPLTASRLASPGDRRIPLSLARHKVCVHYSAAPGTPAARDPLVRALAEMFTCASVEASVVALDSALNLRELTRSQLVELSAAMLASKRKFLAWADEGSQSGLETLMRLLLQRLGISCRIQVKIIGVGRVDVVIGDRLVVEMDGAGFHTGLEFEEDRRRDFELVQQGYLVMRLSYRMVFADWDRVERGILTVIRRGEHRWSAHRPHFSPSAG